jgi:hypothetical protein
MRCETIAIKPVWSIHIFSAETGLSFNPRVHSRPNFPEEECGDYRNCEKRVKDFLHYIFVMFVINSRSPDPGESLAKDATEGRNTSR